MKALLPALCVVLLAGCTIPEKVFHGTRANAIRRRAVPIEEMPGAFTVDSRQYIRFDPNDYERVVVLTTLPKGAYFQTVPPEALQLMEITFQQSLLERGYRTASRLNVPAVVSEMAFPLGMMTGPGWGRRSDGGGLGQYTFDGDMRAKLLQLFNGDLICLVRLERLDLRRMDYTWKGWVVNMTYERTLGTYAAAYASVELVSAKTGETYWAGQIRLETPLQGQQSPGNLLEALARTMAARIPTRDVASAFHAGPDRPTESAPPPPSQAGP